MTRRSMRWRHATIQAPPRLAFASPDQGGRNRRPIMNSIVYIVGLVVIVIAILSFLGLR